MPYISNRRAIDLKKRKLLISFFKYLQNKVEKYSPSIELDQQFLKQSNFFIKSLTWGLVVTSGLGISWLVFAYTDEVVIVNGKLEPIGDVKKLQIPIGGVVKEILVKSGDKVTKGQVLIVLDKKISQQNVQSIQSQFLQKNNQLNLKKQEKETLTEIYNERITLLKERLILEQKKVGQFKDLFDEGAISEVQYFDQIIKKNEIKGKIIENEKGLLRQLLILEQQIKIIDSDISKLKAVMTEASVLLDYKTLRAPVDGVIFDLKPNSVGFVAQTSEPIMKIVPFNKLEADIKIPSNKIGFVQIGMPVEISIDSYPASDFGSLKGKIESIGSDVLDENTMSDQKRFFFPGRIKLKSQEFLLSNGNVLPLQVGMSLTANIKLRRVSYLKLLLGTFRDKSDSLKRL